MAATVVPTEIEGFAQVLTEFIEGKWGGVVESVDDRMDGTEILVRTRYAIRPAHRHGWSRVIYVLEDITEREHAEEERE